MRRLIPLFFCLWLCLPLCLSLQAAPLLLSPGQGFQPLAEQLELYRDPSLKLEIADVRKANFVAAGTDTPNMGLSTDAFWLRFSLKNDSDQMIERLLEVGHPNIDQVWFYRPLANNAWEKSLTGRQYPFKRREVAHRNFVFQLQVPAHSTQTYYLRTRSTSAYYVPMQLYTPLAFALKERDIQLGFGFYYGLIFVMLFYNLVLWLSTRDINYVYYVSVLLVLHGLLQLTLNGLGYEYLWPWAVWWNNHCLGFFLGLSVFLVVHFSQSFLNTAAHSTWLNRFLSLLKYLGLLMALCNLTPEDSWTMWLSITFNIRISLLAMPAIWLVALRIWLKGDQAARYFLIAWSSLLLGGLITGFTAFGWLPSSFWTTYALQIGTGIEVILLSLALGDRLRRNQEAILEAQQLTLEQERKAKAAQERLIERLKKLDRLKDEFIANISHELRTPLNGIIGITESMRDGATGELSQVQKYNLSLVVASGRRLFHLVSDLIDFSQIKHREIRLHPKPVWLREIVEVVLKLSQPLMGHKELQLINDVDPELPPLQADEDRLQQILHNLVANAIKFTASGEVRVSAETTRNFVEITVADTGQGIPEEAHERIFESFEQADGSITREHGGSGLGLAITRQLVELHGGRIRVESKPGEGARFHFLIPLASEATDSPAQAPVPFMQRQSEHTGPPVDLDMPEAIDLNPKDGQTFHILVVDDEPVNLQVLVNMLALQRYTVTRAHSGKEALEALKKQEFDLVLLDVMMPHMSGYEVCEAIREQYPANELPVVFLTARNQVADLVQGFETGANDYLTKPVAKNELLARIQTHIQLSKINLSYARFVPDEFLRYLGHESILEVQLGDQVQQEMTILFADIRDFTALSETMTPKQNFDFINDYLSRISPIIRINQGFIDKYIGDGVMALFPQQAQTALEAAIDMLAELATYNAERQDQGFAPIQVGIGLHTGMLMLGTIGESERMEGTVISDAVNTAARMEGLTKLYGCTLIVSEQTLQQLPEQHPYPMRYLGKVRVKGKSEQTGIYEVLEDSLSQDYNLRIKTLSEFEAGVTAYFERDLEGALLAFQAVLAVNPADQAALYYAQRCERFLKQGLPEDVSPAFV